MDENIIKMICSEMNRYLNNYQMSKLNEALYKRLDSNDNEISNNEYLDKFIIKSPTRRRHKIKTEKLVKETYSDEVLERLRNKCDNIRNLAIIDLLSSSGMRISELVNLNIEDINFENKSCIVFGKGKK